MKSGMLAAEATYNAINSQSGDSAADISEYQVCVRSCGAVCVHIVDVCVVVVVVAPMLSDDYAYRMRSSA